MRGSDYPRSRNIEGLGEWRTIGVLVIVSRPWVVTSHKIEGGQTEGRTVTF